MAFLVACEADPKMGKLLLLLAADLAHQEDLHVVELFVAIAEHLSDLLLYSSCKLKEIYCDSLKQA